MLNFNVEKFMEEGEYNGKIINISEDINRNLLIIKWHLINDMKETYEKSSYYNEQNFNNLYFGFCRQYPEIKEIGTDFNEILKFIKNKEVTVNVSINDRFVNINVPMKERERS